MIGPFLEKLNLTAEWEGEFMCLLKSEEVGLMFHPSVIEWSLKGEYLIV